MTVDQFVTAGAQPAAQPEPVRGEIIADPKRIEQIRAERKVEIDPFVAAAKTIEISTGEDAEGATEVLAEIQRRKKALESERKKLAEPINEAKNAIQNLFNGLKAPLDEARAILEPKLLAYQDAEERRIREENARREREQIEKRRAEEERIAAERKAAAEAAAQAEREAREASEALAREASAEAEAQAVAAAEAARKAEAELAAKREERPAFELAEREEAQTTVKTTRGSATRKKVWTFDVVDAASVPREFMAVDEKKIRQAVKNGEREIPGVRIYEKSELAVRA